MSEQEQLSNSQLEFEQEQEFCNHAEMRGGGGDAKRAPQKRAKLLANELTKLENAHRLCFEVTIYRIEQKGILLEAQTKR